MIYFVLMCISMIGNGTVIWIFTTYVQHIKNNPFSLKKPNPNWIFNVFRSKSLRSASNMFIVNLAIFDFIMMLEMPMFIVNSFTEKIMGSDTGCNIYAALGSVSGIGGAITNAVIAFDRYKTISDPLDGRLSKPQAGILIAITWLWTLPFTLLPILKVWGRYIPGNFYRLKICSRNEMFNIKYFHQ